MHEFIRLTSQYVIHKSGYEVYSSGRDFIGYKNGEVVYKIQRELGRDPATGQFCEIIFTSSIYDINGNVVALDKNLKNEILKQIVKAEIFMDDIKIELID